MTPSKVTTISKPMLQNLPDPVQKWILNSGVVGTQIVNTVHLVQDVQILMKPEQKEWQYGTANQYFTIDPPAFNWVVELDMKPAIEIVGRDKFENGKGEMMIKMFSLIALVDAKKNKKLNEATMQRYLAETVWFPSAALSPYISWEQINENAALATMSFDGVTASGTFYFDDSGNFEKFVTIRYKDIEEGSEPMEWTVIAKRIEERNGIKIPVELEATWRLKNEDWTWMKLKIQQIEYNTMN